MVNMLVFELWYVVYDFYCFVCEVFDYYGIFEMVVIWVVDLLLMSDLCGIDLYGVVWLWVYVKWFEEGYVNLCF